MKGMGGKGEGGKEKRRATGQGKKNNKGMEKKREKRGVQEKNIFQILDWSIYNAVMRMTLKVTQAHQNWCYLIGSISIPTSAL